MPELKPKDWPPEYRKAVCVKGIFVRGCVQRGTGSSFRATAHAHIRGPWKGWVCVRKASRAAAANAEDRHTMLHELAHLISGQGHTDHFREVLRDWLGVEPSAGFSGEVKRLRNQPDTIAAARVDGRRGGE